MSLPGQVRFMRCPSPLPAARRHRRTAGRLPETSPARGAQETLAPVGAGYREARGEESGIVARALAGDSEALGALFARHAARLYRLAYAQLRNKEDAEDAVQDAWLSACAHLQSFEGRSQFSTWLTRIAINAAWMIRRRRQAHPEAPLDAAGAMDAEAELDEALAVEPGSDPEQACAAGEASALLEKQLNRLSPPLRSAFRLRYIEDLPTADAMQATGLGKSALKSRARRAREKLALRLNPLFLAPLRQPMHRSAWTRGRRAGARAKSARGSERDQS